jgi:hypothetical protein
MTVISASLELYEERQELQEVLSAVFSRSSNMEKMLRYVCEKYFEGQAIEIKEYSIAVDALGRPHDFDPTEDSIVRVEAHRLRIKLARYYQKEGSQHPIQIVLPSGGYVPQFIRVASGNVPAFDNPRSSQNSHADTAPYITPVQAAFSLAPEVPSDGRKTSAKWHWTRSWITVAALIVIASVAAVGIWHFAEAARLAPKGSPEPLTDALIHQPSESPSLQPSASVASPSIRILAGTDAPTLTDENGEIWLGDRYFQGGDAESVTPKIFSFTTVPSIYLHRRRGTFSYAIPLANGVYELRLHFADAFFGQDAPDGGGESSRLFDVKANGKALLHDFDVIADAGGSNTADIKIFNDIGPASDGLLHLDFIPNRNVAFVNAIEIFPTPSRKMRALRVHTGTSNYKDDSGVVWDSDRYFRGGVHVKHDESESTRGNSCEFHDERFGNFVYSIPVVRDGVYTVKLWFCNDNVANLQPTGQRENIFNVYLNGSTLLQDLSIPDGKSQPRSIVKQFTGIKPNAQGKLIFSFVPTLGYASLNGIEIDQE